MYMKLSIVFSVFIISFSFVHMIQAGDKTPQDFIKEAKADVQAVSIHDVKKLIDTGKKLIILDVRDKEEFEKEHIPGAINISRGQLEFMIEDKIPDKDARIVVY
jgi:3-mercaptopyruvate sulfurtransferase SseA